MQCLKSCFDALIQHTTADIIDIGSEKEHILDPHFLKEYFKSGDLHTQNPSMYNMVLWMCKMTKENAGGSKMAGISFDEFIQYAAFYFSMRSHDEGLKYMFELFDRDRKGYLTRTEFIESFSSLETGIPIESLKRLFIKATKNGDRLYFGEFALLMKKDTVN